MRSKAEMQLDQFVTELATVPGRGPLDLRDASSVSMSTAVTDVVHDSRTARSGTVFCAVPGLTVDGHDYVEAAAGNGACVALVERFVEHDGALGIMQIRVANVRRSMAHAAAIVHGQPSRDLQVFGITGTNGKTTTTHLLASIVNTAGKTCSVIGTLGGVHTTPESPDLQRQLRSLIGDGTDVVALEVSSHALDQHRVDAIRFAVVAFSNLTPDHLDYHRDMESYFQAKAELLDGRAEIELINVDDPWGDRLAQGRPGASRISLTDIEIGDETIEGTKFIWRGHHTAVQLPGRMNVANALMAAEAAVALGIDEETIAAGLMVAEPVAGRMQVVTAESTAGPTVIVDYSHTPDSIERALTTLRSTVSNAQQLSIVFGCGGDRDRSKRPLMGRAAEQGADRVYLTSDNPRSEQPDAIIADALAGCEFPQRVIVDADRKAAIFRAIIDADPGDVVLIAGKGHEKTQTVGGDVLPFDDVQIAHDILMTLEQ